MDMKVSELPTYFDDMDFPLAREAAAEQCSDVTVRLADGEADLGSLVADSTQGRFESADDMLIAVQNTLPRKAVGEPFQSEGEG